MKTPLIRLLLLAALAPLAELQAQSYYDTPYAILTYAGSPPSIGSNDGTGAAAQFYAPSGVAVDAAGNTYVSDTANQTIRKVTPAGVVTTIAGTAGSYGSTDGVGAAARFNGPRGIAVDSAGYLYVADSGNHTIRKIFPDGTVQTIAGHAGQPGSTDGSPAVSKFKSPYGIAVNTAGDTVYVADSGNHEIRMITAGYVVSTYAGSVTPGSADGTGAAAGFNVPRGVTVDESGNVYVADTNNSVIRKIAPGAIVTTLAGTAGVTGSTDDTGNNARFYRPFGITVTAEGDVIYVADYANHTVRKVTLAGVVTTLAGQAGSYGSTDGTGNAARFFYPVAVAVNTSGDLSLADSSNFTIRSVTSGGVVTTLAGTAIYGSADGTGSAAQFSNPQGTVVDAAGNVYVADTINHIIRKIAPGGVVTTLAGAPGTAGSADGTTSAARFNSPYGIALDLSGNLYVTDASSTIRKIAAGGVVTTVAGTAGITGSADGTGAAAQFNSPGGLAADSSGNIYVADFVNNTIRQVTPSGVVTTLAGMAGVAGAADGTGSAARFNGPRGVAVDPAGNIFVADTYSHAIRKITPAGVVTHFAGGYTYSGASNDGTGLMANFNQPTGIASDSAGNLYVSDAVNRTIRKILPTGLVSTLAGFTTSAGTTDGTGRDARFSSPAGVAVDGAGNLYVADAANNTIRKGVATTGEVPYAFSTLAAGSSRGITIDPSGNVYITDSQSIRKITPGGVVTTLAGLPSVFGGYADGTGSAARFNDPVGVVYDGAGNLYVADAGNHVIRKVAPGGVVTTIAGSPGVAGATDGTGSGALFAGPGNITIDSTGTLWVTDTYAVRKIDPAGVVTTVAGSVYYAGYLDGMGSAARFSFPSALAVDASGTVYVADTDNHVVRKIAPGGVVTTFAGTQAASGLVDGVGSAAQFGFINGLAMDGTGNLYVADDFCVRKITPDAIVTTLAGLDHTEGTNDGMESSVRFYLPEGIAVDAAGDNLYVADTENHLIRKGTRVTDPAPAIVHQPPDVALTVNNYATFMAAASGIPVPTLQWQRLAAGSSTWVTLVDDATYVGVTTDTLIVNGLNLAMSGDQFRCVATSSLGSVTSNAGTLTILIYPSITLQPINQSGFAGAPVAFTAAASGVPTPTLQWQWEPYGSISWNDLSNDGTYAGVTTGNLTINSATMGLNGYHYRCVVTNTLGTVQSNEVILTVNAAGPFDFNADGHADLLWGNTVTGDRGFWLMNGTNFASWVDIGIMPIDWHIAATADFNGDGQTDILWENMVTGDRGFWLMNGVNFASWVDIGIVSTDWHIAAVGDFNGDGKPDILWENTITGDRGFWLMNGTTFSSWVDIGIISTSLRIVGAADFNTDGKPDIVWENTATGKRVIWFMNGTTFVSSFNLGIVSTDWHIAAPADYNGDGQPDILWENTITGDRGFWLMNGTSFSSWVDIGVVSTDWRIAN